MPHGKRSSELCPCIEERGGSRHSGEVWFCRGSGAARDYHGSYSRERACDAGLGNVSGRKLGYNKGHNFTDTEIVSRKRPAGGLVQRLLCQECPLSRCAERILCGSVLTHVKYNRGKPLNEKNKDFYRRNPR